jgi:hypothetical protein
MVIVRRRWNGDASAAVDAESLYGLHMRSEPGGVCSAFPRTFVCAHVWCDKLPADSLGHLCKDDGPHELLVYVLPTDNSAEMFEGLRVKTRG